MRPVAPPGAPGARARAGSGGTDRVAFGAMELTEQQRAHLDANAAAGMITVGRDGRPKVVRVGIGLVGDKVWSSGTRDRRRTQRLRADPRCTLYVPDAGHAFLAVECDVTILDGADAPELSVRFFRQLQGNPTGPIAWFGQPLDEEQFRQTMVDEGRIIYEMTPVKVYGLLM